ncbi:MAG: hydroxylamine reductase, partial [Spirochaetia bacterium]
MFCHQCQETMRNQGCNAARGVCGKTSDVADLQDLVLYACKGIGFWATKALEKGIYNEEAAFFVDRMLFA